MKKYILIIPLFILTVLFASISTHATYINGVEYEAHSYELYQTVNNENYYNVRFYIDDVLLQLNMTMWYNTLDNVYAVPHSYSFKQPIIFWDGLTIVADGIHTVYIDYDLSGASNSGILLLDIDGTLVGSIEMSDLTTDHKFIMIRSAILDPYNQGYEDGSKDKANELTSLYQGIINDMQQQHLIDTTILEQEVSSLEQDIIDLNILLDDAELTFYDLGYDEAINFAYQNGFDSFVSYIDENSYSYLQGRINGINEGSDLNIGIRGFVPSLLGAIGGFFLTLGAIEFLGLSINGIITFLAILILILFVIKLIFGGGD